MSAADAHPDEERFASLLAACDDALAGGGPPPALAGNDAPPELRRRVEDHLSCLHLLRRLLPCEPTVAPGAAPPDAALWGLDLGTLPVWLGRFRLRRELGRGGFGVVLLADDPLLGRQVALKVPRAGALMSADLRERFLREAKAAARLEHPNVAPVYEAGAAGPICYIVSAYCPGPDLAAWLKQRPEPPDPRTAAALTAAVADGLHHAHGHGVLHRDVKPSNVLLMPRRDEAGPAGDGLEFTPRLTDFGLAKVLEDEEQMTTTGVLMGTAPYMAPEQAEGRHTAVGPATDVYALGAILYEMLAGRPPLQGATLLATLEQVRSGQPAPPGRLRRGVSPELATICLKCLRKDTRERYASAGALAGDLRRFLAGEPIQARPVGWTGRVLNWCRRPERIRDAGVVAVIVTAFDLVVPLFGFLGILCGLIPPMGDPARATVIPLTLFCGCGLPMIWITRSTLARKVFGLWIGAPLPVLVGLYILGTAMGSIDTGGMIDLNQYPVFVSTSTMVAVVQGSQVLSFLLALFAYYSNRPTRD